MGDTTEDVEASAKSSDDKGGQKSNVSAAGSNEEVTEETSEQNRSSIIPDDQDERHEESEDDLEPPPPLPPRPTVVEPKDQPPPTDPATVVEWRSATLRPRLPPQSTTAVSLTDIFAQPVLDSSRDAHLTPNRSKNGSVSEHSQDKHHEATRHGQLGSGLAESSSIRSYVPSIVAGNDVESLLEALSSGQDTPAWKALNAQIPGEGRHVEFEEDAELKAQFGVEFDELEQLQADGSNEEEVSRKWRSRLKHFFILSSAGKPIFSRHGDDSLISGYIGIIQTIISSFLENDITLRTFNAGNTRFVILTEGPLYLVAVSRLEESDSQLRVQLEALYMQILSTLTSPVLTRLFSNRPSTDLRRPLQGTEPLLAGLADSFTRGSPSTLLSALECLRLNPSHRQLINTVLLKTRVPSLLYGLIVAGGRLVSAVRPEKHSLHPGDLQLIFNLVYAAGGVKASEGENWIPLCLPGFNNRGYLYMYASFLGTNGGGDVGKDGNEEKEKTDEEQIAILLISADKESFYELKKMRDETVVQLEKYGSIKHIQSSIRRGRPVVASEIISGGTTVLRHFLYRSHKNVQFVMSSYTPDFDSAFSQRQLINLYHTLHSAMHVKNKPLRMQFRVRKDTISLAWMTKGFEIYCVAAGTGDAPTSTSAGNELIPQPDLEIPPATGVQVQKEQRSNNNNNDRNEEEEEEEIKTKLFHAAQKICRWITKEEEKLFILGGAVF
ncbi:MAG: Vacuolar fusion protein mon1 [Watsoniomyces obsoletus]|nr:MAG: Vacuolar fusion protein mon1 [Watsoniomyces obsoletus]